MKFLLSKWSGRLVSLLVPIALFAISLAPASALASKEIRLGRDRTGGSEGDPLDTNDCGGGGGGSDIHNDTDTTYHSGLLILDLDNYHVILVPEFRGGTLIFKVMLIQPIDFGRTALGMEEYHAP